MQISNDDVMDASECAQEMCDKFIDILNEYLGDESHVVHHLKMRCSCAAISSLIVNMAYHARRSDGSKVQVKDILKLVNEALGENAANIKEYLS